MFLDAAVFRCLEAKINIHFYYISELTVSRQRKILPRVFGVHI